MKLWEYLITDIRDKTDLQERMNALGEESWELVLMAREYDYMVFKRPLTPKPAAKPSPEA